jgi:hypothetical protein
MLGCREDARPIMEDQMARYTGKDAFERIRELAAMGVKPGGGHAHAGGDAEAPEGDVPGCSIRTLPDRLQVDAAGVAGAVNPVNLPPSLTLSGGALPDSPMSLTVLVSKYFGPAPRTLTVSFLETTPADLRTRIIAHMNAWTNCCGVSFRYTTGTGQVRISRAFAGYWSYLGTDILLIPPNQPTMNLQGFSMATRESEYKRVVRHETGHTLGFPHEHMRKELVDRIDPAKAYPYFLANQGWDKAQVDQQVLRPLDQASILGTPADQTSIMCYQLPAQIMKDGKPIVGGIDINATDCAFSGSIYPKAAAKPKPKAAAAPKRAAARKPAAGGGMLGMAPSGGYKEHEGDWADGKDVDVESVISEFGARGGKAR